MKKIFILAVMLSIFILFNTSVSTVNASQWYVCNVISVGPSGSLVMIQLTDTAGTPAFSKKWFCTGSDTELKNRILATILTAVALEMKVKIAVANLTPSVPLVTACYLYK